MSKTLRLVAMAMQTFIICATAHAQRPVLQRGYDAGLTGANLTETALSTYNVAPATFGKVFTLPVDDKIYAQPLYVPHVGIAGHGTHNVVYVATMSDELYAFDADVGGAALWSVNFASSVGAQPVPFARFAFAGNTNIAGNLGILSTPVIDPTTGIMYLVACTLEDGTMVYRLHAVNIANGTEPYKNVVISGSYGGEKFDAPHQTQRVSLTLSNNNVVFAFGAVENEADDEGGYGGWVMAYNKRTLEQSGVFAAVTTGTRGGGLWQSGRPPAVDGAGYVYVFTGNGFTNGYDGVNDFSESVLKLKAADGIGRLDWFTPSNWKAMDATDLDLSSSGPMLIPDTTLLAGGGKTGVLYVLNTNDLGHYSASDSGAIQKDAISGSSIRGGPVYWQRSAANGGPLLYDWAANDWVKAYAFNGRTFSTAPTHQGSGTQVYPGGILTLSANGQTPGTGVLWATVAASGNAYSDPTVPGVLYAFDADNVAMTLWSSAMNPVRDNFGNFAKLVPPLVANGKVYVATFSNQVAVYGLLAATAASGSVNLSAEDDVVGIDVAGKAVSGGGLDGHGFAYAENLLGTSITWNGSKFTLGGADVADAVSSRTIKLPAGKYADLKLLATGVNGNQANQAFVVTYTDGTTTSITQNLSDWYSPQNYHGESIASTMAGRIMPSGATDDRQFHLYGYSFALNGAKTVQSITLPNNRDVVTLALDLVP